MLSSSDTEFKSEIRVKGTRGQVDRVVWWQDAEGGDLICDSHGVSEVGGRARSGIEFKVKWKIGGVAVCRVGES